VLRQVPEEEKPSGTQSSVPVVEEHHVGIKPSPAQFQIHEEQAPIGAQTSSPIDASGSNPIVALTIKQWLGIGGAKGVERFTRPMVLALVVFFSGFFAFIEPGITGSVLTGVNLLLVLLSGAASIAGERENKTWDAVRLTRIGTARIILGKWFNSAFPAIVTQVFFALILLISPVAKSLGWQNWLLVQAIMGATTLFAAALSVHVSSTAATVQKAQSGTAIAALVSAVVGGILNQLIGAMNPILFVGTLISPGSLRAIVDAQVATFPGWILTAIHVVAAAVLYLMTLGELAKPQEETILADTARQGLDDLRVKHIPEFQQLRTADIASNLEMTTAAFSVPLQALLLRYLVQIPVVSEHPLLAKELRSILMPAGTQSRAGSLRWTLIGGAIGMMFVFTILTAADGAAYRENAALRVYLGVALAIWMTIQLAATSIPKEREKQTWNAMLLSRISLREIVASKGIAACVPGLLIILAILPMLMIGMFASGTALHAFITAPLLMLTTLGVAGSVGMLLGAINRSSRTASLQAALITMGMFGILFVGNSVPDIRVYSEAIIGIRSAQTALIYILGSVGFTALFSWLAMLAAKRGPREFDA
jgi:ABC-type Na+ efflux pump permease subunit